MEFQAVRTTSTDLLTRELWLALLKCSSVRLLFRSDDPTIVGYPLDTLKVRLQTQPNSTGALNLLRQIAKKEGVRSDYLVSG